MELAQQLRVIRKKLLLTQEGFAQELSVTLSTVNRWETGKSKPNLAAMRKIKLLCENHKIDYKQLEQNWL